MLDLGSICNFLSSRIKFVVEWWARNLWTPLILASNRFFLWKVLPNILLFQNDKASAIKALLNSKSFSSDQICWTHAKKSLCVVQAMLNLNLFFFVALKVGCVESRSGVWFDSTIGRCSILASGNMSFHSMLLKARSCRAPLNDVKFTPLIHLNLGLSNPKSISPSLNIQSLKFEHLVNWIRLDCLLLQCW